MSAVCSLDPRTRERIHDDLRQLAAGLRRDFRRGGGVRVRLVRPRRAEHEGSDIDLLVVGELPGRVFDRVGEVLRRTSLPVEPIVVTPATFERRRRQHHPLFEAIAGEGLRLV